MLFKDSIEERGFLATLFDFTLDVLEISDQYDGVDKKFSLLTILLVLNYEFDNDDIQLFNPDTFVALEFFKAKPELPEMILEELNNYLANPARTLEELRRDSYNNALECDLSQDWHDSIPKILEIFLIFYTSANNYDVDKIHEIEDLLRSISVLAIDQRSTSSSSFSLPAYANKRSQRESVGSENYDTEAIIEQMTAKRSNAPVNTF